MRCSSSRSVTIKGNIFNALTWAEQKWTNKNGLLKIALSYYTNLKSLTLKLFVILDNPVLIVYYCCNYYEPRSLLLSVKALLTVTW